jgi:hypothetical protein
MKAAMKKTVSNLAVISALLLLGVTTSLADGNKLKDSISIPHETVVNGTKLKPGTYEIRFDADANEVSVLKGGQVIVTAKASVKEGEKAVRRTETYYSTTDKGVTLTKLVFKGDERAILLNHSNGSATAGQ